MKKLVKVEVIGGVVQEVLTPMGVVVHVKDYDELEAQGDPDTIYDGGPEDFISYVDLDIMESLASDTKKCFEYDKHLGTWSWYNRGEEDRHQGFNTRLEALRDAVAPYLEDEQDE